MRPGSDCAQTLRKLQIVLEAEMNLGGVRVKQCQRRTSTRAPKALFEEAKPVHKEIFPKKDRYSLFRELSAVFIRWTLCPQDIGLSREWDACDVMAASVTSRNDERNVRVRVRACVCACAFLQDWSPTSARLSL